MQCISVVIADRHPVVLLGLTNLLGPENGFKVVASCSDGTSCLEAIRNLLPDIAIFDISMPGLTGLEILAVANSESLPTRLVFFTASIEDRELVESAAEGAYGVIPKDVAPDILVQSLRQVAEGQRLLPLPASLIDKPLSVTLFIAANCMELHAPNTARIAISMTSGVPTENKAKPTIDAPTRIVFHNRKLS